MESEIKEQSKPEPKPERPKDEEGRSPKVRTFDSMKAIKVLENRESDGDYIFIRSNRILFRNDDGKDGVPKIQYYNYKDGEFKVGRKGSVKNKIPKVEPNEKEKVKGSNLSSNLFSTFTDTIAEKVERRLRSEKPKTEVEVKTEPSMDDMANMFMKMLMEDARTKTNGEF